MHALRFLKSFGMLSMDAAIVLSSFALKTTKSKY